MSTPFWQTLSPSNVRRFGKRDRRASDGIVTSTLTASTRKGGSPLSDFPTGGLLFDRLCISGLCVTTPQPGQPCAVWMGGVADPGPEVVLAPSYLSAFKGDAWEGVKAMRLGSEGTPQTRAGKAVAFTKGTPGSRGGKSSKSLMALSKYSNSLITKRLKLFGFQTYRDYLRSELWKSNRRRFYTSPEFDGRCYCCGRRDLPLELHHRSYKNLGNEKRDDLLALCGECHDGAHKLVNRGRGDLHRCARMYRADIIKARKALKRYVGELPQPTTERKIHQQGREAASL